MAKYRIVLVVDDSRIDVVRRKVQSIFGQDIQPQIDKLIRERDKSRSDRLGDAESSWDDAKSTVETLKDEMQEWLDKLPEQFRDGDKGTEIQECIEALDTLYNELDNVDWSSVSFPSMM